MRHATTATKPDDATGRVQPSEWNLDHVMPALSVDPSDPGTGKAVMWMSDGTDTGSNGDIIIKVNVGGVTKTATLLDYSILS